MASITITTTAEQDAAATRYVALLNKAEPTGGSLTPVQWVRRYINDKLDALVREFKTTDSVSKAEAYRLATPTEQATIDAILAKYQG